MKTNYFYAVIIFIIGFGVGQSSSNWFSNDENVIISTDTLRKAKETFVTTKVVPPNPFALISSSEKPSESVIPTKEEPVQAPTRTVFFNDETLSRADEDYWHKVLSQSSDLDSKLDAIDNLVGDQEYEQLAFGLGDISEDVRKKTITGLGTINTEGAIRIVGQALLSDPSAENRLVVVNILARNLALSFPSDFLKLAMQNDLDSRVRERAAAAIGLE
jgi:hypothetical protein